MFSSQPTGIFHYFSLKKLPSSPTPIHHYFYASWEDAVWDLLVRYHIPKNASILLPSFFCPDVIANMKNHHLTPIIYPQNQFFHTPSSDFIKLITKHSPAIIVIFHPAGMTADLYQHHHQWLPSVPPDTLLIEDCVHRIVNPTKLNFIRNRHFIIDSQRKTIPLPGSNLFAPTSLPVSDQPPERTLPHYKIRVFVWWMIFQALLALGSWLPHQKLKITMFIWAEKAMVKGYDLIGDSLRPVMGWHFLSFLYKHLDYPKIYRAKYHQVKAYLNHLAPLRPSTLIYTFPINPSDYHQLRGFPIGLYPKTANEIISRIRQHGLLVRSELAGSLWTKKHQIIYLPLGPHLKPKNLKTIAAVLLNSVAQTSQSSS